MMKKPSYMLAGAIFLLTLGLAFVAGPRTPEHSGTCKPEQVEDIESMKRRKRYAKPMAAAQYKKR